MSELTCTGIVIISTELNLKEINGTTHVLNFVGRTVDRVKDGSGEYKSVANFFHFEIWDTAAEYLANNAKKGDSLVVLSATPKEHTWDKDGEKHSRVIFRINKFKVIPWVQRTEDVVEK